MERKHTMYRHLRVRTSSFELFPCQTLGGTLTSETKKDAKFVGKKDRQLQKTTVSHKGDDHVGISRSEDSPN